MNGQNKTAAPGLSELPNSLSLRDAPFASRLAGFFNQLADDYSRATLGQVLAHRCNSVQSLPRSEEYQHARTSLAGHILHPNSYLGYGGFGHGNIGEYQPIHLHQLDSLNFPVRLHGDPHSLACTYLLEQYRYRQGGVNIAVEEGDTVIDAGAFVGDTALYFAILAGDSGQIHSFEAQPYCLEIFRENLALNPVLARRVKVVRNVIWEKSDYVFSMAGDINNAYLEKPNEEQSRHTLATSVSLDDFVVDKQINRVDFIKMDIEGAELAALKGATNVLRRQRPKLAIAIYHRPSDMVEIPEYIASLALGYRFYVDHFTDRAYETILFADPCDAVV